MPSCKMAKEFLHLASTRYGLQVPRVLKKQCPHSQVQKLSADQENKETNYTAVGRERNLPS